MLAERFPPASLRILPRAAWLPYPPARDRAAWAAVSPTVGSSILDAAASAKGRPWPALPSTLYLEYAREGNRSRYQGPYYERRGMLASFLLAECLEDRGRYVDAIADGIWLLCEESSWCLPAHIGAQRAGQGLPDVSEPIVDLFAAETAAELAWTSFLLGDGLDAVSALLRPRIAREVRLRIVDPYLAREDFTWMGFAAERGRPNNWNPWINSNVLAAGLLLEEEPELRGRLVAKAMRSLDRFLDPYPRDGGCDEGPGYWGRAGASVFDCLQTLRSVTGGQVAVWDDPLIREIGRFIVRAQISGSYFLNFADASAVVHPPAGVLFGYGERIGDAELRRLGAWLFRHREGRELGAIISPERALRELFMAAAMDEAEAAEPLPRDVWLPEVQIMASRDRDGSAEGLYVAAKGGHNAESHNHNDIGSFVVYTDGCPLVVDAGVGEYTRATFSPERYSIWTMQSAFHSLLPAVDGVMQAPGAAFAARGVRHGAIDDEAWMELDIAGAYPAQAGIRSWLRRITLRRREAVIVEDSFRLEGAAGQIVLALLTPCAVSVRSPGEVLLSGSPLPGGRRSGSGLLAILADGSGLRPDVTVERLRLADPRLEEVWGEELERIVITLRDPGTAGRLRTVVRRG